MKISTSIVRTMATSLSSSSKFYYFGFGSNMLAKRIHIQNSTAVRIGPGKLQNYRLDFHTCSENWQGAPATIVPTDGEHVFGAIWEIDCCNLKDLDNQEGVSEGIYAPIQVPVISMGNGVTVNCRTYHLLNQPISELKNLPSNCVPIARQPSKTYLKTIVKGAIETGLPANYVLWLRSLCHNGIEVDTLDSKLDLVDFLL